MTSNNKAGQNTLSERQSSTRPRPASQAGAVRASDRLCPSVVSGVCPWCVRAEVGR